MGISIELELYYSLIHEKLCDHFMYLHWKKRCWTKIKPKIQILSYRPRLVWLHKGVWRLFTERVHVWVKETKS